MSDIETLERDFRSPRSALESEIAALGPWFHNLHLPGGTQTAPEHPLGDFPAYKWKELEPYMPESLEGWTALDIGCNAGFYTFELARRGARVTGIDVEERYLRQARWAARRLGLERVRFEELQIYDLARSEERWDLVLFMGVFYHLRYPLLALDIVSTIVRRKLVFQTLTLPEDEIVSAPQNLGFDEREAMLEAGWPRMAFVERRLAGDPTNWWVPNRALVEAVLRSAGLEITARPGTELYVCRPDAARTPEDRYFDDAQFRAACGKRR